MLIDRLTERSQRMSLAERAEVVRAPDGGWLLTGAPVGIPTTEAMRIVRMARGRGGQRRAGTEQPGVELAEAQAVARADS